MLCFCFSVTINRLPLELGTLRIVRAICPSKLAFLNGHRTSNHNTNDNNDNGGNEHSYIQIWI